MGSSGAFGFENGFDAGEREGVDDIVFREPAFAGDTDAEDRIDELAPGELTSGEPAPGEQD